ncbi:MAG: 1-aminocyclopropane-1-carboxylate deaminase [Campylobacterales bacterium]|nr:1-aminocyclopropane-1-carboxylate deaminase [Campylobacterales bacterium]
MLPSAVTHLRLDGRLFYIKRDDLIDPLLSGNKFRKLFTLIQSPLEHIHTVISYGGIQSNAMLSMAALAHQKGWRFDYYTKRAPAHVKQMPEGNLKAALELGMCLHEIDHGAYEATVRALFSRINPHELLLPQGGSDPMAERGMAILADEIKEWQREEGIDKLSVAIPSGTGASAYFLAKHLDLPVLTTPLIGDAVYLRAQMDALGPPCANLHLIETKQRYRFGTPYQAFLSVHQTLRETGVVFDLLYAPKMWLALLEHLSQIDGEIMYIHSGGVYGNATMMERYMYAKMV